MAHHQLALMISSSAHAGAVVDSATTLQAVGQLHAHHLPISFERGNHEDLACRLELRGDLTERLAARALIDTCLREPAAFTVEEVGGVTVLRPEAPSVLDRHVRVEAQVLELDAFEAWLSQLVTNNLGTNLLVSSSIHPNQRFSVPAYAGPLRGLLAATAVLEPEGMSEWTTSAGVDLPKPDRLVWTLTGAEPNSVVGLWLVHPAEPVDRPTWRADPVPTALESLQRQLEEARRHPTFPGNDALNARQIEALEQAIRLERERQAFRDE